MEGGNTQRTLVESVRREPKEIEISKHQRCARGRRGNVEAQQKTNKQQEFA